MSESLTEPRTNVNECSNPLHDFCKQNTSGQDPFVIPYLSVSELGKYISRLENKTSSGLDGISNQLLKLSFPYVIDSLTYVFNLCIEKNVFPSELKKAKVVPLPEPTDKTNPTNYRPVSLLSVLSKLLEKHVHIYLNDYLEKRQLLHPFQSGFRRKYTCNTALARLTNSWLTAMNKTEVSGVFLDLKKAFDLVDHDILLKKLAIYLKNSSSLPFLKSYLHNRTQCVLLHGSYSSKESVKYGVPQGSVLGPIRFSLFINDLPLYVEDIFVDCDMLADDTALHTSEGEKRRIYYANQKQYARQLRSGIQCCDNNHMVINPIKTKSVTIATRQKHQLSPLPLDLVLNEAKIDQVSEHRLLDITIDNKLCWDSHINNEYKTVSRPVFLLSKLRYIVDIDTRKLFFNAHIKSHIDYASVVWDGCSDVLKKRLNSLHRTAVKLILPDTTLTTDQKLKEMRILSLQTQLE